MEDIQDQESSSAKIPKIFENNSKPHKTKADDSFQNMKQGKTYPKHQRHKRESINYKNSDNAKILRKRKNKTAQKSVANSEEAAEVDSRGEGGDEVVDVLEHTGIGSVSSQLTGKKYIGSHTSVAGGLYKCIEEAIDIGAKSCGLFLKSQRQWACKPLTDEVIQKFKDTIKKYNFPVNKLLPHGSYLINCGSPDPESLEKSRNALIDELQRCELLGIQMYNFHPGSSCGKITVDECLDNIGDSINFAHSKTKSVITVVENMCCQGNTVGGKLEELKGIINRVKNKRRIGICIDTCHAFAAGYDISTESGFKSFLKQFDEIIGFQYLKALHLNDSKGKLGCHLDRHENIGKGEIGLECFKYVMKEPNFNDIPILLETPWDIQDREEIQLLNSFSQI